MKSFSCSELSIQCWNIHGLFHNINGFSYNKLESPHVVEQIENKKIFCFIETHHTADDIDKIQILGFKCYQACRKKLKFGRKSGGIAVYVHNSLLAGVSKVATVGSESILLKLSKGFFSVKKDVVLSFTYCVPANSSFQSRTQFDAFGDFEQKLGSCGSEVDYLCLGDFNSRTSTDLDYIQSEDNTDIPVPTEIYETDTVATYPRGNMDKVTNSYGDKLIALCKSVPLRICNGRKLGDILGSYTCHTWNGQSTVDYCLTSPQLYKNITTFQVGKILPTLSDHCPIIATLKTNFISNINGLESYKFISKPMKVKWDKEISQKFENVIQTESSKQLMKDFLKIDIPNDQSSIDSATNFLSDFLVKSAEKAGDKENKI